MSQSLRKVGARLRAVSAVALLSFGSTTIAIAQAGGAKVDPPAQLDPAAKVEALAITARTGRHAFSVEVMRTDAERSRGLMFRRSMAPDHGMLFDFERSEPVAMWMKNTYLPLDMVFIRTDGTIARVAADTEPLSTKVIPSSEPVLAVLELNAGTAARLGLRTGDRVDHPMFRKP